MSRDEIAIRLALREYLCEGITSRETVRSLEAMVTSAKEQDPIFEELEALLALYNPGGGSEYADDVDLRREIRWLLIQLGENVADC